jgi:hypothetical protein
MNSRRNFMMLLGGLAAWPIAAGAWPDRGVSASGGIRSKGGDTDYSHCVRRRA